MDTTSDPRSNAMTPISSADVVLACTDMGSLVIKSVLSDFGEDKYTSWSNERWLTRLERAPVKVAYVEGSLDIQCRQYIKKIVLLNAPVGQYVLNVNGMNIMSSKDMIFDCAQKHKSVLASADSIKLCYNKQLYDLLPSELLVELELDNEQVLQEVVHRDKYNLMLRHPTTQLSIQLTDICPNSSLEMYVMGHRWFTVTQPPALLVINFMRNLLDGVEDVHIPHAVKTVVNHWVCCDPECFDDTMPSSPASGNIYACNFSRLENVYVVTKGCKLAGAQSSYYMTYFLPSKNSPLLMPCYK